MTWKTLRRAAAWGLVVLWALIIGSFVVGCETAHADGFAVPAPLSVQQAAQEIAAAHWGAVPVTPNLPVTWTHLGATTNAHSGWLAEAGSDPSTWADESIQFSYDVGWDWPKFCTVMVHEYGHLLGHDHVEDPANVMNPYYTVPVSECTMVSPVAARLVGTRPGPAKKKATPRKRARAAKARGRR